MFQLFESFVIEKHGDVALNELYNEADIPKDALPFLKPITYPDKYLSDMISALSAKKGMSADEIVYDYGKYLVSDLLKMYPELVENIKSASELLKKIENIHVVEIKKLYPDATPPDIKLKQWDDFKHEGILTYRSPRRYCRLVEGVLDGVAAMYKEKIAYEQLHCMNKGDKECVYKISISKRT